MSSQTRFSPPTRHDTGQEDGSLLVWTISSTLTPIAIVLVLLRLILSFRHRTRLQARDFSLLASVLLFSGLWAEQIIALQNGLGKKFYTLSADQLVIQLQVIYAWRITHAASKIAAQMSILFMLKEAWTLKNRVFRYGWWATTILTIVTRLLAVIINAAQCKPISKFWDVTEETRGSCLDYTITTVLHAVPFGVSSVMLLALPMLPIFFAKVSISRKIGMWILWTLGFFLTWCIGAYPTLMVYEWSREGSTSASFVEGYIIGDIEVFIAVMIASIPGILGAFARKTSQVDEPSDGIENDFPEEHKK